MKYKVMIVEDQTMPRELFELRIQASERFEVALSIDNAALADVYCLRFPVDLILMDVVTRGGESGLDAAERIKRTFPQMKIIIVTSMPECSYLSRAREIEMDYVATGHYGQIVQENGRWLLKKSVDTKKDQTYFLYNLTQEQMAHFLLPLGGLTKVEVREIAAQHGFLNARKRDSQDICFVPNGDYGGFIEHFTGTTVPCGNYIDRDGNVLGTHKGHIRYTLGQRKNLNIALGKRAYVVDKDVNANTVTLGDNDELYANGLVATDLNLIACDHIHQPLRCTAKTRHTQLETPCTVEQTGEDELLVRFDTPVRAVTPGQAVVLYDGDVVLGGGTIVKPWHNDQ